jgi:Asp-tRNA(Asn)/Glu-tRNA(Gln) amidotransferase A subunit family amidase
MVCNNAGMSEQVTSLPLASSTRRGFLAACAAAGVGGTLLPGVLLGMTTSSEGQAAGAAPAFEKITPAMIDVAAAIAGVAITDEQKAMLLDGLVAQRESVAVIRTLHLQNATAPAFVFDPVPGGMVLDTVRQPLKMSVAPDVMKQMAEMMPSFSGPTDRIRDAERGPTEVLAFSTVRELAELVRTRRVSSTTLTKMYLGRLKQYDPKLHFVITLTEERALTQAAAADAEIAAGKYRGPLHGIPWGAKDLLAVKGYRTPWGAAGFEDQHFDEDAEVVKRLDAAGAVLVAKLSMGALAQGDLWFGGRTRNPWNTRQGSSGSSAGSASAVSAGCVGFAIGTETLGSISSPSTRCGVTGLRPTFGFVPRTGAMALSWSMDKIGPICRAVEDCALVLSAIHGPDGRDRAVKPAAFNWDAGFDWKRLRVGYLKSAFDAPAATEEKAPSETLAGKELQDYLDRQKRRREEAGRAEYDRKYAVAALEKLRGMGVALKAVEMPQGLHFGDQTPLLAAEGAAAFDELTLSGRDKLLTGQKASDWPNTFRKARFYSAVDYVQAMRARTLTIEAMARLFADLDVIVTPSGGAQLTATNLSGHPAVIVPNGLRGEDAPRPRVDEDGAAENAGGPGTPVSLTFLGGLYSDARLAAFARAYQEATGFHRMHPRMG